MQTQTKQTSVPGESKGSWTRAARMAAFAGVVALGAALQGCGGGGSASVCDPPQVGATWSIDKQATGAPLTCDQAAAVQVEMTLNGTPFDFDCNNYQGITTSLTPGAYNADFALLDVGGNVISQTQQMTITVGECGVTDLGDVLFDVQ